RLSLSLTRQRPGRVHPARRHGRRRRSARAHLVLNSQDEWRDLVSVATIEEGPLLGPSFFLSRTALRSLALAHRDTYGAARPYPHVVIDGFLGERLATGLAEVFPDASETRWIRRDHQEQAARLG